MSKATKQKSKIRVSNPDIDELRGSHSQIIEIIKFTLKE